MISKKSICIVPLFIILFFYIAYAQTIYKWVDDQGQKHFTTIYDKIPPKYRNQVQKPERPEEAETTKEAQPEKETVSPPEKPPIEERAEVQVVPSLSQPEEPLRKAKKERRPKVELEGSYWITDLSANTKLTESGIGTDIDLKEDLGLKDENYMDVRLTWYTGPKSELRLAYTQVAYRGDENIQRTIEFGGETFTGGTRVKTDVDVKYIRLGWAWQFIDIANSMVKLGTLLEAKAFLVDTSLDAPDLSPPIEESVDAVGVLPTVGIALDINPHKVINVFAEVSGIYAGEYGYSLDGEAGVKIIPIKNLSVVGGWRILGFKIEDDPDFVKLEVSGPFVGATLRF